jgi:hypothetical protein
LKPPERVVVVAATVVVVDGGAVVVAVADPDDVVTVVETVVVVEPTKVGSGLSSGSRSSMSADSSCVDEGGEAECAMTSGLKVDGLGS